MSDTGGRETPIRARFGSRSVAILEISSSACLIEHVSPIRVGTESELVFSWGEDRFYLIAMAARSEFRGTKNTGPLYESLLRFVAVEDALLRGLIRRIEETSDESSRGNESEPAGAITNAVAAQ